jgi:hypothetical protein
MGNQKLSLCDEIARACDILNIVLRVLYDSTNIVFFDIDDFDILIWALLQHRQ